MCSPPDRQKEREQEPIQVSTILNPAGLDVEASALAVLKGRFHAHAPRIVLDLPVTSSLITDEQPSFLASFVPDQTDKRFQRLLLPDPGFAIPAIARLEHNLLKTLPGLLQFAVQIASTGMLLTHAQEIVPATLLAEFDQGHPA